MFFDFVKYLMYLWNLSGIFRVFFYNHLQISFDSEYLCFWITPQIISCVLSLSYVYCRYHVKCKSSLIYRYSCKLIAWNHVISIYKSALLCSRNRLKTNFLNLIKKNISIFNSLHCGYDLSTPIRITCFT